MNLHEFQSKELMRSFGGIAVSDGEATTQAFDAVRIARNLGGTAWAVKAQIHAGGRGLGGGVKIARSLEEVRVAANAICGMNLVTKQTGAKGKIVSTIYIEKAVSFEREFYLSFAFDRAHECVSIIASSEGGMGIEEVAPEKIKIVQIDPLIGFRDYHGLAVAGFFGLDKALSLKLCALLERLYAFYWQYDANLVEINPLVLSSAGDFVVLDAKVSVDDAALFRQTAVAQMRDLSEEEPTELEAKAAGLSFVKLDGNIGCMVNGAGLAMGTMDAITLCGGVPANFLDVGGGASAEAVAKAFELILKDEAVRVVFVNIFGGIVRCERVANGILEAVKKVGVKVPIVVRLEGTNAKEAGEILRQSGLSGLVSVASLQEGAQKCVEIASKA